MFEAASTTLSGFLCDYPNIGEPPPRIAQHMQPPQPRLAPHSRTHNMRRDIKTYPVSASTSPVAPTSLYTRGISARSACYSALAGIRICNSSRGIEAFSGWGDRRDDVHFSSVVGHGSACVRPCLRGCLLGVDLVTCWACLGIWREGR